jgi:hypothetical protein
MSYFVHKFLKHQYMKFNNLNINKSAAAVICFFIAISVSIGQVRVDEDNNVGIGTSSPNANAKLEIVSTNGGFLKPRLTTVQRIALPLGFEELGLEVYDKDLKRTFWWDGDKWVTNASGTDADPVIGNEITNVTNNGLVRIGDGTASFPYMIALPSSNIQGEVLKWIGSKWEPRPDNVGIINVTSNGLVRTGAGTTASPHLVGLPNGGVSGNVLKWNGTQWVAGIDLGIITEVDGIIGNEITNVTGNGLVRTGTGTTTSPYVIGLPAGATDEVLKWNGTMWMSSIDNVGITTEVDGVVGNEITNVTGNGLVRTGTGTTTSPYTISNTSLLYVEGENPQVPNSATIRTLSNGAKGVKITAASSSGINITETLNPSGHDEINVKIENSGATPGQVLKSDANGVSWGDDNIGVSDVTGTSPLSVTNNNSNSSTKNVSITPSTNAEDVLKTVNGANNTKVVTWGVPSDPNAWKVNGNNVTASHFIGTNNNLPLIFKVGSSTGEVNERLRIDQDGRLIQKYQGDNSNVVIGTDAILNRQFPSYSVYIGENAGKNINNTADPQSANLGNTFIGAEAGSYQSTGGFNILIGYAAGNRLNGDGNVIIGNQAGPFPSIQTYNDVIAIGTLAKARSNSTDVTGGIAIGRATNAGANSIAIGNLVNANDNTIMIGAYTANGGGTPINWTTSSDKRIKKEIKSSVIGIEFIEKLNPVQYYFDMAQYAKMEHVPDSLRDLQAEEVKGKIKYTGFIAQEVEAAAKQVEFDFSGVDKPKSEDGIYGLRYSEFVVPLVKAVQEQQTMIENLQTTKVSQSSEIEKLKTENETIKNLLNELSARLTKLENK